MLTLYSQDFVRAFCLGFDVDDAVALLRLDDLYIQTFGMYLTNSIV
jgi:rRNA processing protein Krr1/Pno1